MFTEEELERGSELWRTARAEVDARHPSFLGSTDDVRLRVKRIANQLIKACINDLIRASSARIGSAGVRDVNAVRSHPRMLIGHGPELRPEVQELQAFLQRTFYRHPYLMELSAYARALLGQLFAAYVKRPVEMSPWYRGWAEEVGLERAVCDYLAGMTDRFAEQEHARLCARRLEPPQRAFSSY
jgi:dGTPase